MQWHIINFPVPKGRKHWTKARTKPTRANKKLCSSMPNVWDFKGLRWICPSSFAVCETQLSQAHYIPRRKQMMSHGSGISNICRLLLKPDYTLFFIWVLHTWTPHLCHSHTFLPQFQLLSCSLPSQVDFLIIIATYTIQTHTLTCMYDLLHAIIFAYIFMCPPTADHLGLDNLFGACPWRKLTYLFLRGNDHLSFFFKGWDHVKLLVCTACQLVMVLLWSIQEALLLRLMGAFSMSCLEDTIEQ